MLLYDLFLLAALKTAFVGLDCTFASEGGNFPVNKVMEAGFAAFCPEAVGPKMAIWGLGTWELLVVPAV